LWSHVTFQDLRENRLVLRLKKFMHKHRYKLLNVETVTLEYLFESLGHEILES
jgi:hypothetical protein